MTPQGPDDHRVVDALGGGSEDDLLRMELASLARQSLGYELPANILADLVETQRWLRARQAHLAEQLDRLELSDAAYLDQVQSGLIEAMRANKAVLGARQFESMFGDVECQDVIDPEIFARERSAAAHRHP